VIPEFKYQVQQSRVNLGTHTLFPEESVGFVGFIGFIEFVGLKHSQEPRNGEEWVADGISDCGLRI